MRLDPLRFWLPMDNGMEQEILIPAVYVHTIMIPAAGHEAGHGVVAHHYGARVIGIAVGFIPERRHQGMLLHALHEDKSDWSTETRCVVKAAGPAADLLIRDAINEQGASGNLQGYSDAYWQCFVGALSEHSKRNLDATP
jgi:hypothetical protein